MYHGLFRPPCITLRLLHYYVSQERLSGLGEFVLFNAVEIAIVSWSVFSLCWISAKTTSMSIPLGVHRLEKAAQPYFQNSIIVFTSSSSPSYFCTNGPVKTGLSLHFPLLQTPGFICSLLRNTCTIDPRTDNLLDDLAQNGKPLCILWTSASPMCTRTALAMNYSWLSVAI